MKFKLASPRLLAALISATFLVFAAGSPAFGQATTTTTNEEVPISNVVLNTCNGDVVNYQGTLHITNTVTTDASGGFHIKTHTNYQDVSGVGTPSGVNYRVSTTSVDTTNDNSSPQLEMTVIQTVKVISLNSTPNLFLQFVFHITINANGQTTSTVTEVRPECRG